MSWRIPDNASRQLAYQIQAGDWDSGRVDSDKSILIPYAGPPLRSRQEVQWAVKVWTDKGESAWSDSGWWEMGLLQASDWRARWIEPPSQTGDEYPAPVWLLQGTAIADGPIARARLYVTALGIYEFFINGQRVCDRELTPGFTSYDSTLHYQTYDVTDYLQWGANVLGAVLSGGWVKWTRKYRHLNLALLAQLEIEDVNGHVKRHGTDVNWRAVRGRNVTADLLEGQVADLRLEPEGWCLPGASVGEWRAVELGNYGYDRLTSSPSPPVRKITTLKPRSISSTGDAAQVVDFGQNINGWTRLARTGPRGTEVVIVHGESVDPNGEIVPTGDPSDKRIDSQPFQRDLVISSGRPADVFEPRHTTHGFRYVSVGGLPFSLEAGDLTAEVVHTDMRRTGWFTCSNERINRLHEAAVWGFRGNACDIPTDCPSRERAGWTGDWQIFVSTAAFLYDVAGFSAKWLHDLASDQLDSGVVWHLVPNPESMDFYKQFPPGSAGWGDAAVIVPWEIYRAYGDADLLAEQWESMAAWVGYAVRAAQEQRHPSRTQSRRSPEPHERHLWDTGFHWGEWLEPDSPWSHEGSPERLLALLREADHGVVATAYLRYSTLLLSRIATVLDRPDDAQTYAALSEAVRRAWQIEFFDTDEAVNPLTQANCVRALAFELVPETKRANVAATLNRLVRDAGMHVGTGFLATPYLLPVLAENGYLETAYGLLFQDTEPSWLAMVERGATTIWEHWNGVDADGVTHGSLNHYSKGAVISFLHRNIAGIQLLDDHVAYRHFRIAPQPGRGLTSAEAAHDSPYGRIETAWRTVNGTFVLDVRVPPGTTAEVTLPSGTIFPMNPGSKRFEEEWNPTCTAGEQAS